MVRTRESRSLLSMREWALALLEQMQLGGWGLSIVLISDRDCKFTPLNYGDVFLETLRLSCYILLHITRVLSVVYRASTRQKQEICIFMS